MAKEIVLVTGGAGFIGSNLVRRLVDEGKDVRVIDDLSTGRLSNLMGLLREIEFIKGDVGDASKTGKALKKVRCVYHIAAIPSVPLSVEQPVETARANVGGTVKLLELAVKSGVKRFVFASSCALYGDSPQLPKREEMAPAPLSPYAASKLSCEYYCKVFTLLHPIETVALRFFNVFGPRQDPSSEYAAVVPRFIAKLQRGEPAVIYGDGKQTRDFIYVEDVVNAVVRASSAKGVGGKVMNVACGKRISVLDLAMTIGEVMKVTIKPIFLPPRDGDIRHSYAAIGLAKKLLGFRPRFSLREGLARTIEWFTNRAEKEKLYNPFNDPMKKYT